VSGAVDVRDRRADEALPDFMRDAVGPALVARHAILSLLCPDPNAGLDMALRVDSGEGWPAREPGERVIGKIGTDGEVRPLGQDSDGS